MQQIEVNSKAKLSRSPLTPADEIISGLLPAPVEADRQNWLSGIPVVGPALLGMSIGLQWMMTGIILYGPMRQKIAGGILTPHGTMLMRPERDMPLYIAGSALCLMLMIGSALLWRGCVLRQPSSQRARFACFSAGYQAFLAVSSVVLYLLMLFARVPVIGKMRVVGCALDVPALLLPSLVAMGCCWRDMRDPAGRLRWKLARPLFDVLLACALAAILLIPPAYWNDLAGMFYIEDLLHHWNYFGMGPALCFAHGGAFSTDFYSQYGMGWPLIFAAMDRLGLLTYGRMIGVGIVYGTIYYVGFYVLLRTFLRSASWAAAGVLLAVTLQMFSGQFFAGILWQYPSSTMLRHSMDVWFFLALLQHLRTGKPRWAFITGLVCGLAIFFGTETGLYLAVVFGCYLLLTLRKDRILGKAANFGAGLVVGFVPLAAIASRGTLIHAAFWRGMVEGVALQGFSGLGLLPIADVSDTAMLFFMVFLLAYLLTIGVAAIQSIGSQATDEQVFLACFALYGMALLLIFVGRSHPFNLYHPAPPLAVVVVGWLALASRRLQIAWRPTSVGAGTVVVLLLWLLSSPDFAHYPSLLSAALGSKPSRASCLLASPPDLAMKKTPAIDPASFHGVVEEMRQLNGEGYQVAAVDFEDTLLYYASGVEPWFKFGSLFHSINTQAELKQRIDELVQSKPRYVVLRAPGLGDDFTLPIFENVRQAFHDAVQQHAQMVKTIGHFEIWRWRDGDQGR